MGDEVCMPFTGHIADDLAQVLGFISNCDLPVECFDAFLLEYKNTGSLHTALNFARDEWDL